MTRVRNTSGPKENGLVSKFDATTRSIALYSLKLTKRIHAQGYKHIIVSGNSHIVACRLFLTSWETLFPNAPKPRIHIFDNEGNNLLYRTRERGIEIPNRLALVQDYIDQNLPDLNALKGERICFLEEFAAKGNKYHRLRAIFPQLGFEQVEFAFIFARARAELKEDAYVALVHTPLANALYVLAREMQGIMHLSSSLNSEQLQAQFHKQLDQMAQAIKVIGSTDNHDVL